MAGQDTRLRDRQASRSRRSRAGDINCCYGILNACFAGDILRKFASERDPGKPVAPA